MAAKRTKATDKKNFTLEARFPEYVGYADYFLATPVTVQVRNDFTEAVSLTVSISCESGLLVPYEARAEVPFESAVQLAAERIFSPLFLAENDGLRLGLGALDGTPGADVSKEERWAAIAVAEARPWLRHPTAAQAQAFERTFGPVRTDAFASARRLAALQTDARAATLRAILTQYRKDPGPQGEQERLIALSLLGKDEAAALLNARKAPSEAELELFLCTWPWTPEANALYAKHADRLAKNACLSMLYANRLRDVRQRQAEQVGAYFMRDGRYAYALFHLNHLLAAGDLNEALGFVGGFTAERAFAEAPFLLEGLRLRALAYLADDAPETALRQAHDWLIANPAQPDLWGFLLGLTRDPEALDAAVRDCLALFPGHPLALRLRARALRPVLGEEGARRWRETLLSGKAPHADR